MDVDFAALEREHCEPCEGCGTSLMKRGSWLSWLNHEGPGQPETWAVPDGDSMKFVEHTHQRCAQARKET
jgi:hypothetical protein